MKIIPKEENYEGPPLGQAKNNASLSNSIEMLIQLRTAYKVRKAYDDFLKICFSAPAMLQHDFQQFLFPFFIHLAYQLYKQKKPADAELFIKDYRKHQPAQCQPKIDQLLQEQISFKPPQYVIHICQFALDDLFRYIESRKLALLTFIMTTQINLIPAPFTHELLFIENEDESQNFQGKTILENMPIVQPPFSVIYQPNDLTKQPSIIQDDNTVYLTQPLVDVAHFVAYNHNNRIQDMKISKCARLMAMAQDSSVVINSLSPSAALENGKPTKLLTEHYGKVLCTSFSDDSRYIVSGGLDCQIRVAHLEAFRPFCRFKNHIDPILDVTWHPNNFYLAAASQDQTVSMWSLNTPNVCRIFAGHSLSISKIAFSKDGHNIISCSDDLTMRIWDIGSGEQKAKFHTGRSVPIALDIHPNNQMIACGCTDGSIVVWDTSIGKRLWTQNESKSIITDVKFTNEGNLLLSSNIDGQLFAWDLNKDGSLVMKVEALSSSIDSICVTRQNLVCTTGRSIRGGVKL